MLIVYRKTAHPRNSDEPQGYEQTEVNDTLNAYDMTEVRTPPLVSGTIDSHYYKGQGEREGIERQFVMQQTIIRRLTPKECERLQGFPDDWTNIGEWTDSQGKKRTTADSARYRALGNSIALPFWQMLANRIAAEYDGPATMASLFDGIGGFPLVFQQAGVTPVWASEIEEFPMAVTKVRFPEE